MRYAEPMGAFATLLFLAAAGWSAPQQALLADGKAVAEILHDDAPGEHVRAAIDIPADAGAVWRVLTDCEGQPDFVPKVERCEVQEAAPDGSWEVRAQTVRFLPILPRLTLRTRTQFFPERELRFTRAGGDMEILEGFWRITPRAGGVRLEYEARMKPKAPAPGFLLRGGLKADVTAALEALGAEVARRSAPEAATPGQDKRSIH